MTSTIVTERPARSRVARARSGARMLGPAFVAAIAYVDPGNVATNVTAGTRYGYLLVWVVVAANVMAALVQFLSAKLGIVTGRSLPEALRDRLSRPARLAYWVQAEVVTMATDLAEVLGGAVALRILFGLPLPLGGLVTGAVSMVLLSVQNRSGQRPFERMVTGLLAVIAVGFVSGLFVSEPSGADVAGGLLPRLTDSDSVLLAAGILGATMMPHAVYLHSALTRDRYAPVPAADRPTLLRITRWDVGSAMLLAGAVNLGLLVFAAAALSHTGVGDSLEEVHAALGAEVGGVIALLFALGLLASGLASTAVGCHAGSVVMAGLLNRRVPLTVRRLATLVPALVILAVGLDPTRALVISQVVLSFGIPFALIPLVILTSRRAVMADAVNGRWTTLAAWAVTALVVTLNTVLIVITVRGG